MGDQAAGARLGRDHAQAGGQADRLEALGEGDQIELGVELGHRWVVSLGAAGGAKNQVSGLGGDPSEPSDWPFRVKKVTLDLPVRTSIVFVAVKVRVLPSV